jgi:hypothetical protein
VTYSSCLTIANICMPCEGSLAEDTKLTFVKEVQRIGQDPVFWVRREASYALGALAKVVPVEIVVSSLVCRRFNI